MSRELAVRGERYPSRRDNPRNGQREVPVYNITDLREIPAMGILGGIRVDESREFVAHLIAALQQYGAETSLNQRSSRDGDDSKVYGTLTVRFTSKDGV